MERKPFCMPELFFGDKKLFNNYVTDPKTIFVYDIDGILTNTSKNVLKIFTEKTGIKTNPQEIDEWYYLTKLAKNAGLTPEAVKHAEDDWFDPKVLLSAPRNFYAKPIVQHTVGLCGRERNFVLTSRNPNLKDVTVQWLERELQEIDTQNILIRKDKSIGASDFKVQEIRKLASIAEKIVFIDDSTDFAEAVLSDGVKNCLVVNVPQGQIMPNFRHERLVIVKRYPDELQSMYPLYYSLLVAHS